MTIAIDPIIVQDSNTRSIFTGIITNYSSFENVAFAYVQIASNSNFATILTEGMTTNDNWYRFAYARAVGTRASTIYARLKVIDQTGDESNWSNTLTVLPQAIAAPTITFQGATPYQALISVENYGKYTDITLARLQISTSNTFPSNSSTVEQTSTTDFAWFVYLLTEAQKTVNVYYRLRYEDADGVSSWSNTLTQTPAGFTLEAPTIRSNPTLQAINLQLTSSIIDAGQLVFRVAKSSTDWTTENGLIQQTVNVGLAEATFPITAENRNSTYYGQAKWRRLVDVTAEGNEVYVESEWSSTITIAALGTIGESDLPPTPIISEDSIKTSVISSKSITSLTVGTGGFAALDVKDPNIANSNKIELTVEGLTLKDSSNNVTIKLPTDPNATPIIKGNIIASSLSAEKADIAGSSSILKDSTLTLSQGRIKEPTIAPTVSNDYPTKYIFDESTAANTVTALTTTTAGKRWGLWLDYTNKGGPNENQKTVWVSLPFTSNAAREYLLTTVNGVQKANAIRTLNVGGECHSACRAGGVSTTPSRVFAMYYRASGSMYINSYSPSNLTLVKSNYFSTYGYEPSLIPDIGKRDATSLQTNYMILIDANTSSVSSLRIRTLQVNADGSLTQVGSTVPTSGTISGTANYSYMSITSTMKDSSTLYVAFADTVKEKVLKFTLGRDANGYISSATLQTSGYDASWPTIWGFAPWGLSWDSSLNNNTGGFLIFRGDTDDLWQSTASPDVDTYEFYYNFRNASNNYATTLSPKRTLARVPFSSVAVSASQALPTFPTGISADEFGYYAKRTTGSSWSNAWLQANTSATRVLLPTDSSQTALSGTTSQAPSLNNFPVASPAKVSSEYPGWTLSGDGTVSGIVPVGSITAYVSTTAPTGWLLCDGSAVSRETYQSLWDVIRNGTLGTSLSPAPYGNGDGSTTFNLPNLQQRFPLGKAASGTGSTLGSTGGSIDHSHSFSGSGSGSGTHSHGNTFSASAGTTGSAHEHPAGTYAVPGHSHAFSDSGTTGTGGTRNVASGTVASVPTSAHTHGFSISGTTDGTGGAVAITGNSGSNNSGHTHNVPISGGVSDGSHSVSISISGTTGTTNPPFLTINYIIKT